MKNRMTHTPLAAALALLVGLTAGAAWAADPPQDQAASATRTLDAITIEGAVDVPQVLFITSRDNARFEDGLGWWYLPAADEILAGAELPAVLRPNAFETETATEPAAPEVKE
jgi:hypothetical protein